MQWRRRQSGACGSLEEEVVEVEIEVVVEVEEVWKEAVVEREVWKNGKEDETNEVEVVEVEEVKVEGFS